MKKLIPIFILLIIPTVFAYTDAEITGISISKQVANQDEVITVAICIVNTGNETFNFPVGLTIGYSWNPSGRYFEGESCNSECYVSGGDYTYTGSLDPEEEVCILRDFKLKSDKFYNGKQYDIVVAVYNETYKPPTEALDLVYWRTAVYVTDINYQYVDEVECDSGWGDYGQFKSCLTSDLYVPSPCPDKYVIITPSVNYNFTYSGDYNQYGFWDSVNVSWVLPSEDMFFIETYDISSSISEGSQFSLYVWSDPNSNQKTAVHGIARVYCNMVTNVTIDPDHLEWSMTYMEQRAYLYRIKNLGNVPLHLLVDVSDYRWMCVKDSEGNYHTSSFWIDVPAGGYYDIAVTYAPAGGGPGDCNLVGLPTDETNKTHYAYVKVTGDASFTATQTIFVGSYCDCTTWEPQECVNSTHRRYTRTCTPSGCLPEEAYFEDPNCAEQYVPTPPAVPIPGAVENITSPFIWVNETEVRQAGYSWVLPFLTPLFWDLILIFGVSGFFEYKLKTNGIAFLISIIGMSLLMLVFKVLSMFVGVILITVSGIALWYILARLSR